VGQTARTKKEVPRFRQGKAVLLAIGSVLALLVVSVLTFAAMSSAHGDLFTVLVVISFILAAILGIAIAGVALAALFVVPVLVLVGAARLVRHTLSRRKAAQL